MGFSLGAGKGIFGGMWIGGGSCVAPVSSIITVGFPVMGGVSVVFGCGCAVSMVGSVCGLVGTVGNRWNPG